MYKNDIIKVTINSEKSCFIKNAWFKNECNRHVYLDPRATFPIWICRDQWLCVSSCRSISDNALSALLPAVNSVLHPT